MNNEEYYAHIITILNKELQKKCECLQFYYIKYPGYEQRKIGIYHTESWEELSYIDLSPPHDSTITITISRTSPKYLGKGLNTCLRYVAVIIASKEKCYLLSEATSPVSLHLMYKHFNSEIENSTKTYKSKNQYTPEQIKNMLPDNINGSYSRHVKIRAKPVVDVDPLLEKLLLLINEIVIDCSLFHTYNNENRVNLKRSKRGGRKKKRKQTIKNKY